MHGSFTIFARRAPTSRWPRVARDRADQRTTRTARARSSDAHAAATTGRVGTRTATRRGDLDLDRQPHRRPRRDEHRAGQWTRACSGDLDFITAQPRSAIDCESRHQRTESRTSHRATRLSRMIRCPRRRDARRRGGCMTTEIAMPLHEAPWPRFAVHTARSRERGERGERATLREFLSRGHAITATLESNYQSTGL